MSYTFLAEQGAVSSAESFSDIPACVLSRLNLTAAKSCSNASETGSSQNSQSGTTLKLLTEGHGVDSSMSYAVDSPATISQPPATEVESADLKAAYGPMSHGSLARLDRASRSWKTHHYSLHGGLMSFSETWPKWGTMRRGECFPHDNWVPGTSGSAFGFSLPTPNSSEKKDRGDAVKLAKLNQGRGNRLTRTICDRHWKDLQPIWVCLNPCFAEMMMGWPIGHTALKPLEPAKFREWLSWHGKRFQAL